MTRREEKKDQTRTALASAAMQLFSEKGFDAVTVAEVAEAVGVSRRTAFRYFPTKDSLVMENPDQWMRVFQASLEANEHEQVSRRLREASYAVAAHIEADPKPVMQLFALAFSHPALAAGYARSSQAFIALVAEEMSRSTTVGDDPVTVAVLAAAYMGMVDGVCSVWAQSGGSMIDLLDTGFAALDAGLGCLDN